MLTDLSPISVSPKEREVLVQLEELSARSGTHSPSLSTMQLAIPNIKVKIDACYLSNPLATDLFWSYFNADTSADPQLFRAMLEAYPSQNSAIAERLAAPLGIDPAKLFIANGATEAIQAVIHNYSSHIHINIPTFSPYYEFAGPEKQITKFRLEPEQNFALDPEKYVASVLQCRADTAVLISPNNPDGSLIPDGDLDWILSRLTSLRTVVVDESFIHFADRPNNPDTLPTLSDITDKYQNVTVIKSMSKDFGIAGIRAGYAVMQPERVTQLLTNGYLWNTSGMAEYFFSLFERPEFLLDYQQELASYNRFITRFTSESSKIGSVTTFDTDANFQLMQMPEHVAADVVTTLLLLRHGVYVRNCSDKIGLDGEFIRVAIRTDAENVDILKAINNVVAS